MKISAIVTSYESDKTIGVTIMSLFSQVRRPDEIIVTDDGSKDSSCHFVKNLLSTVSGASEIKTMFLTHVRSTPYRLNTIRNRGVLQASGDLIFLIDGDILVPRDFLIDHEKIHEKMLDKGESALISCVRKNIAHGGHIHEGRKSQWGHVLDKYLSSSEWSELNLEPEQTLSQSTFLKEDWERVGRFDTEFDGYWGFDEVEFAYRMKAAGVRLTCHGLVYHIDEGPGAGSRDEIRNRDLYHSKMTKSC